jgi:arsenate reductase
MNKLKILHNQRCSKSRECLAMLSDSNYEVAIVDYLKNPPSIAELKALARKLGMRPKEFLRTRENILTELSLDLEDDAAVFAAMHAHPILIERPIIDSSDRAVVGRPPEKLQEFLRELKRV